MRPIVFTLSYATPSTTSVALGQTLAGAGALTLNGALSAPKVVNTAANDNFVPPQVATLPAQQFITLTSTGNFGATNFTISGADSVGNVVSEVLAGPNNNTVTSVKAYKTITSITSSTALATNVSAGTTNGGYTNWIPLDQYVKNQQVAISARVVGTINYSFTYTNDDPWDNDTETEVAVTAALTGATTTQTYQSTAVMRALKVAVAAGATGSVEVFITQQSAT